MSEILLQAIIEKLEALEIALLKENASDNKAEIMKIIEEQFAQLRHNPETWTSDFKLLHQNISELTKKVSEHKFNSQQPSSNSVEHRYHLHKGIWISAGLLVISILLSWAWFSTYQSKEGFEANAIKYRALKVIADKPLLELLYKTDSLFNLNEKKFYEYVVTQEHEHIKQAEMLRIAGEKKKRKR